MESTALCVVNPYAHWHDVAADAVNKFLEGGGRAQFLFFPIPGDSGIERLEFLKEIVGRYSCSVIVVPSLAREDFLSAYFRTEAGGPEGARTAE